MRSSQIRINSSIGNEMTLLVESLDVPCGGDWLNTLYKKILRSRLTFKNAVLQRNLESADANQKF